MLASQDRPRPRPDIVVESLDEELLLFDAEAGMGYVLNPTAARIWRLLDGTRSVRDIAEQLVGIYALSLEEALAELEPLLESMRGAGLFSAR